MSLITKKYCVFGCEPLVIHSIPIHRFPHPDKHPDLLSSWISVVGDYLKETDPMKIYKNKRICDCHFDPMDKISGSPLKLTAVPSVNINRVQQSTSTFVEADHCYYIRQRENVEHGPIPMMNITNLPGPSRFAADSTANLPSGSMDMTCLMSEMSPVKTKQTNFDAENTFKFLQNKDLARKVRKKENEIRRMRLKLKKFKLRLREQKKFSATRNFGTLTRKMSEAARLFTRMQYMEGKKKKKGHRFSLKEKVMCLFLLQKESQII